jgi:thymidylate kinase
MKKKKIIVFFGIDGTGKTTLIKALRNKFSGKGEGVEIVYMGVARNQKMPLLKFLMNTYSRMRWNGKSEKTTYDLKKHGYRERNFFWLSVYYLELWVRYLLFRRIAKTKYVLCDRYFYDGLVFANKKNFEFFKRLTPRPDNCFLLCVPSDVIMKRKNEAGEKDIKKFYEKADLISEYFDIKKVDNTKKVDKVIDIIYKEINNEDKH